MAGSNLLLKKGQQLFAEGEQADGMYLVRKGELQVYLERDGNEVNLAVVGAGGMIGEMAFFDQKPRSASVKAIDDAEVTKITNDDFAKIMKQIPRWFVSLMSSLSTRLRSTNQRLQAIESEQKGLRSRYETMTKILHVLNLIWAKDGFREGKDLCLNKKLAQQELCMILRLEPGDVERCLKVLEQERVIGTTTDQYKNTLLTLQNRASLIKLIEFIEWFLSCYKDINCLPEAALAMLRTGMRLTRASGYDTLTVSIGELISEGQRQELDTDGWPQQISLFRAQNEAWQLVKMSDNQVGFRFNKKLLPEMISNQSTLAALAAAKLDR